MGMRINNDRDSVTITFQGTEAARFLDAIDRETGSHPDLPGNRIERIKEIRHRFHCGLMEAKDLCERLEALAERYPA